MSMLSAVLLWSVATRQADGGVRIRAGADAEHAAVAGRRLRGEQRRRGWRRQQQQPQRQQRHLPAATESALRPIAVHRRRDSTKLSSVTLSGHDSLTRTRAHVIGSAGWSMQPINKFQWKSISFRISRTKFCASSWCPASSNWWR